MRIHCLLFNAFIALLVINVSCNTTEKEDSRYTAAIDDKIKQVENNLCGWVQIGGSVNTYNPSPVFVSVNE